MDKKCNWAFFILISIIAVLVPVFFLDIGSIDVLNPKGWIALEERDLIVDATLLMLIVVIPVFIITAFVNWKYRASNEKAKYMPDWEQNWLAESIWWGLPCLIVIALSVITWKKCHELDPFKPLESSVKPIRIQAVALQWKWLFIYPELNIASMNFVQFPEKTPLNFEVTGDAPMNSFWIPQLGGQIYAMPGMKTKLHLIAHEEGSYRGSSANLSGVGFAGMWFMAKSSSQADFNAWVESVKKSPLTLDFDLYKQLAAPSQDHPVTSYILKDQDLCERIIMQYMAPMDKPKRDY